MAKLDQLKLGVLAEECLTMLPEWARNMPNSYLEKPEEIEVFETTKAKIYSKFDLLASKSPSEFTALLSAEDLISSDRYNKDYYSNKFFVEYLSSDKKREDAFLNNCTGEELLVYVERNCWFFYTREQLRDMGSKDYFEKFKRTISKLCRLDITCLSQQNADELRVFIIDCLVYAYGHLWNGSSKKNFRDYCAKEIALLVKAIVNVNVMSHRYDHTLLGVVLELNDYYNEHPDIVINLIYLLIERGIKITYHSSYTGEESLDLLTYRWLGGDERKTYDFYMFALDKNPNIQKSILNKGLRGAINSGNNGAIRALFSHLSDELSPDLDNQLQFVDLLFSTSCRVQRETVKGILLYLALNNISVNDVLEYLTKKFGEQKRIAFVKNLFGIANNYREDIHAYPEYEKGETKNVLYYYAQHPELCREMRSCFDKMPAVSSMFDKSNPELCPLTIAVQNKNAEFLFFSIVIMASNADSKLRTKITNSMVALIEDGFDPKDIVAHLQERIEQYSFVFRIISFENILLNAINKKLESLKESKLDKPRHTHNAKPLLWQCCSRVEEDTLVVALNVTRDSSNLRI